MTISLFDLNARVEDRTSRSGFQVTPLKLAMVEHEGRLAENSYFAIAFQPFVTREQLVNTVEPAQLELTAHMKRGSNKVWDTYFILACQADLTTDAEKDQLVKIQYDTRNMRKLVAPAATDLMVIDRVLSPFRALEEIAEIAQNRDPLGSLSRKLVALGHNEADIRRAVALFRDAGSLEAL